MRLGQTPVPFLQRGHQRCRHRPAILLSSFPRRGEMGDREPYMKSQTTSVSPGRTCRCCGWREFAGPASSHARSIPRTRRRARRGTASFLCAGKHGYPAVRKGSNVGDRPHQVTRVRGLARAPCSRQSRPKARWPPPTRQPSSHSGAWLSTISMPAESRMVTAGGAATSSWGRSQDAVAVSNATAGSNGLCGLSRIMGFTPQLMVGMVVGRVPAM